MTRAAANRTLLFFKEVDEKNTVKLVNQITECSLLKNNKQRECNLILCVEGGEVNPAFSFYDIMTCVADIKLTTIATGEVASAGVILLLSAQKERRFITPNGLLFLHNVLLEEDKGRVVSATRKAMKMLTREEREGLISSQNIYINILARETNLSKKKARKLMDRETYLTAEEALEYGFVHEIISPKYS